MSMTVPTIPSLPAGHTVTLADIQALAAAATFLLGKPIALVEQVANAQAIGTSPNTLNNWSAAGDIYDPDGMWVTSPAGRLTIQTPGWYRVCYGINCSTGGGTYNACVKVTTGPNNPAGSGVTATRWPSYTNVTATSAPGYMGASGIWPAYLYVGDFVQLQMQAQAAGTSTGLTGIGSDTNPGSFFSLEWVSA